MRLSHRAALMSATVLFAAPAFAQDNPMVGGAPMMPTLNIVENAVNSADHTTLVAAVTAAGLADTLQTEGPFTVFAPVNAAFDALPAGTVDTLLLPENLETLQTVLTCHVVGANAMSEMIGGMIADGNGSHMVETLGGCMLEARMDGDMITLTDETGGTATVTIADVVQSNGVIHVIDRVMLPAAEEAAMEDEMPTDEMATEDSAMAEPMADPVAEPMAEPVPVEDSAMADPVAEPMAEPMNDTGNPMVGGAPMLPTQNIVENAVNSADHTTLVAAVQAAGLVETLQGEGPFTVFAPVNAGFDALPAGTVETLLMPENLETLQTVLTSHVVAGNLSAAEIVAGAQASSDGFYHMQTVSGAALSAQVRPSGSVWIFDESGNAHMVTIADVNQSNGVIHVVDGVLLPR